MIDGNNTERHHAARKHLHQLTLAEGYNKDNYLEAHDSACEKFNIDRNTFDPYDEEVAEGKYTDQEDQQHYWYGHMLLTDTELGDIAIAWWAEDQFGQSIWHTKAERDAAIVRRVTHTKA